MNKLDQIARTFIFLLLLIPIIINPLSSSPFELSKTFISFIAISLITFFTLLFKKNLVYPNKIILLLFSSSLLSTLFSKYSSESFFGYYPRFTDGDFINLGILLFIFCCINLVPRINIPKIIFLSSIPVTGYLIYESLVNQDRIYGTFGQPNFLSLFLVLCIVYLLQNFSSLRFKKEILILYFFLILFFILKTASLTSLFLLGIVFGWFLYKNKDSIKNVKYLTLLFITVTLCLFYFNNSIIFKKIEDIQNQFKPGRPTQISDSLLIRFALWDTALRLSTEDFRSILVGKGQNTFIYYFENNRNKKLDNLSEKYLFFDKPHNYYLELLFNSGFFSLIIFLYLIYYSLIKKNNNSIYILLISLFIFFNWLDLYFKVILFLLISQNLNHYEIKNNLKPILITLSIFTLFFSSLFIFSDYLKFKGRYLEAYTLNPLNNEYASLALLSKKENHKFYYLFENPTINVLWLQNIDKTYKGDFIKYLENKYPGNYALEHYLNLYR